ncbi:MAG: hypothetical protein GF308_06005 [Candidatus Heimdallarchaeota archaeon]|nr:hypothetical protein [Candidatus Heimdallarchaeota archaeon]
MYFCKHCNKEVLIIAISYSKAFEEELKKLYEQAERGNQLLLINPSPIEPYYCPICETELIIDDEK